MCARAHSTADPSVAGGGGRRIRWGPRLRCPRTSPRTSKRTPLAAALLRLPPHTHAHTRLISLPPPLPPQEVFAPFASHPRYADLTDNIGRVTEFFNRKVEESVAASGGQLSVDRWGGGGGGVGGIGLAGVWRERGVGSAECCRARCGRVHIVSGSHKGSTEAASSGAFHPSCPPPPPPLPRPNCVRRVLDVIKQHSRGWRRDRLKPFPELRFTYEEGECRGGIRCDVCVRSEEGMWGLWREAVRVPPGTRCVGGGSGGKGGVTSQPAQPHRALTHAALACVHTRTRPLPRALCPAETPLTLTPPTPPPPPPPPHPIHAHRGQPRGVLCAVCVEPGGGARRRALDPACHHALHAHRCAEAGAGRGGAERGGGGGGADQAGGIHLPLQAVAAPVLHASPAFNPYVPLLLPRCDVQSCPSHRRCRSRPARRCERMPRQQLRWCTFDTLDVFVTVPPTLQCPPTLAAWLQTTLGDAASLAARLASSLSVGAGAAGPHPDSGAASNAV